MHRSTRIWNVDFSHINLNTALNLAKDAIRSDKAISIAFVNPHSQVLASTDEIFQSALDRFSLVLADGIGTLIGACIIGDPLPERISGPEFFRKLTTDLNRENRGYRYYFLGSTDRVLRGIAERIESEYPGIVLAGTYSPPMDEFSSEVEEKIVSLIRNSKADVLWVGMTAPKQEKWIARFSIQVGASVTAGIGAEFDYFAGTKKRPPKWVSRVGLQWLHRFIQEPRRTWRRHLVSAPLYIVNVLRNRR